MWTYDQTSGWFSWHGVPRFQGYSGKKPSGWNNPNMQAVAFLGPTPSGYYRMELFERSAFKPPVIALIPLGHSAYGRTSFRIHGDSLDKEKFGDASEGCIILAKEYRQRLLESGDDLLEVAP